MPYSTYARKLATPIKSQPKPVLPKEAQSLAVEPIMKAAYAR